MSKKASNVNKETVKPVCKSCGSSNMTFEAIVTWSTITNSIVCSTGDILPYDDSESHCLDCEEYNTDSWVEIEE